MKKLVIGYLFYGTRKLGKEEKIFLKLAKKKNIKLIMIDVSKEIDEDELQKRLRGCKIIFNNSAEDSAMEYVKTLEAWEKKVIDSSQAYYYSEDKWMFFLKCKENKIPVPDTELLCENIPIAKKELKRFNKWPVVLKRTQGTCGQFVERAQNLEQAEKIIEKFWKKGGVRLPIIAQELIISPSYRVTVIGKKIVQTAIKDNKSSWKSTGVYTGKFEKFKVDRKLKKLVKKVRKLSKIKVCGIDFLKKDNRWIVLEVNAQPAFDFFECEQEMLISLTLDLLRKEAKKTRD